METKETVKVTKELLAEYEKQGYSQVCIWEGCVIGEDNKEDFVKWMKDDMGARVIYLEEITTNPTPGEPGTGGRNDAFFLVHKDDINGKFCIQRLKAGIRWLEDAIYYNKRQYLYDQEVLDRYPQKW